MDEFKHGKLVVFGVDAQSEEESRVAPIHNLMVPILLGSSQTDVIDEHDEINLEQTS